MGRQAWVVCGGEFIEGDVIRWHEGVFQPGRFDRKKRVCVGERTVTAQILYDPTDSNELMEVQVLASEGTNPFKPDELIRRARRTVSRADTERLAWSDEGARAAVIDSLSDAQRKAMQSAQASAESKSAPAAQTSTHYHGAAGATGATGAPWRRKRRKAGGGMVAKP